MESQVPHQIRRCPICERALDDAYCPVDGSVTVPDADFPWSDALIGETIAGDLRVLRRLPGGGGGPLYEVRIGEADRLGECRFLDLTDDEAFGVADRFAKVFSALFNEAHPGLPRVLRYGRTPEGRLFVVTSRSPDTSFEDILARRGALPAPEAADLVRGAADALDSLHRMGITHRDVCLFRLRHAQMDDHTGAVFVTDPGLFDVLSERQGAAPSAEGGGSLADPRVMSPEIAAGYSADSRSDVYSLGMVLATLIAGRAPFTGLEPVDVLRKQIREPFPDDLLPAVSEDLRRLLLKATAKSPDERFQSAGELRVALQDYLDLVRMIGHDTDPDLVALTRGDQATTPEWGDIVTIGDDEGGAGGNGLALASPLVLLRDGSATSAPGTPPDRAGRAGRLLSLVALVLFATVLALIAYPFLKSDSPEAPVEMRGAREVATALPAARAPSADPAPMPSPAPPASAPAATQARPMQAPATPEDTAAAQVEAAPDAAASTAAGKPHVAAVMLEAVVPIGQPIAVEIRSAPSDARVLREGYEIGRTPLELSVQSRKGFVIQIEKPGYVTHAVEVLPEVRALYDVHLSERGASPAVTAPAKPKPKPALAPAAPIPPAPKPARKPAPKPPDEQPDGYNLF